MSEFDNKVILITGSSSGIGAETAIHFAALGAKVVITGRDENALKQVADKCKEVSPHGHTATVIVADITNDEQVKNLVDMTLKVNNKVDVLVNNAAVGEFSPIEDPNLLSIYDKIMNTNLRGALYLTHLIVPHLEKSKGCIVNVSAVAGLRPVEKWSVYCMTKAAMDMMTECLALELGPRGIRVNSVNPAYVKTNFLQRMGLSDEQNLAFRAFCESVYPLRRVGEPSDVAKAIAYLASSNASFVTGCLLTADGGARLGQLLPQEHL